jgi:hydrogenase maturation protease
MTPLLVIGYGNELRGDDGVGPRVARAVAEWNRPDVRALAVQQLVPELAAKLVTAERVVFVDARVDAERLVSWRPVDAEAEQLSMGHISTPGWLLGVADQVFGHAPRAWLVTIRTLQFDYGALLSPSAQRGVRTTLRQLAAFASSRHQPSAMIGPCMKSD